MKIPKSFAHGARRSYVPIATRTEAYWYEATKTDKVDRVVYWKKPYTRFAKYQPRRYLEMCGAVCE